MSTEVEKTPKPKKPKAYRPLNQCRKVNGLYILADVAENPSAFFRTEYGQEVASLGVVAQVLGKICASEAVAIAFAIYRDPKQAKYARIATPSDAEDVYTEDDI